MSVHGERLLIGLSLTYGDASERPNWGLLGKKLKYSIGCLTAHNLRAKERKKEHRFCFEAHSKAVMFHTPGLMGRV